LVVDFVLDYVAKVGCPLNAVKFNLVNGICPNKRRGIETRQKKKDNSFSGGTDRGQKPQENVVSG